MDNDDSVQIEEIRMTPTRDWDESRTAPARILHVLIPVPEEIFEHFELDRDELADRVSDAVSPVFEQYLAEMALK